MTDARLDDEEGRLAALRRLEVLDSEPEEAFENIVALVRAALGVPVATVSLVDRERQWFKARAGLAVTQTPRDISFCTHAIRGRDPMVVPDAREDARFADNPLVTFSDGIRSYAGIPLRTSDGYNVGALCAIDTKPRQFTADQIALLGNVANLVVSELELRRIAGRDQLTGLLTRRAFVEEAEREIARFRRYRRPATLALLDIDHSKAINDTHGHPAGDRILREVAELVLAMLRPSDAAGRVGGEEFALLLGETGSDEGLAAAERVRAAIERQSFAIPEGDPIRITASFGLAMLDQSIGSVADWLAAADRPLYAAKRDGRNRCRLAE